MASEQLRPGDTVVVWRLDRLGRSIRHLIDTMTEPNDQGWGPGPLTENIDTTTPAPVGVPPGSPPG